MWKSKVNFIVREKFIQRLKISCKLYKSLLYLEINDDVNICSSGWIQFLHKEPNRSRQSRCIFNLLVNAYRLGNQMCVLCSSCELDTTEHILFVCSNGDIIRGELWRNVVNNCPRPLADELCQMSVFTRTKFLLNAFRSNYIREWHDIYVNVSEFIYKLYNRHYHGSKCGT